MPVKSVFNGVEKSANDDREYRIITLENDLTALLISDPDTEKSAAAANVHVGSWSDPEEALGLAHFLEHMLFLGTEKYPDENTYQMYLSQHGGSSNAYTDQEDTNYFFDVQSDFLEGALDIFAQFFIAPLFTESATNRELNAVDSEHSKNLQNDGWRFFQMCKNLARPDHPFHKFSSGNLQTLKEAPEASGIDVRQRLLDFHATYYSSNVLKLVILGKEPLDVLQQWVDEKFSPMKNKNLPIPKFPGAPYQEAQLKKVVKVVPVRDARTLQMIWPLPSVREFYRSKPTRYLAHLVGHESEGSITALLKEKGWANELTAGVSTNYSDFAAFAVTIELTEQGLAQVNDVMLAVFQYIQMLKDAAPQEWIHDEIKDVAAAGFRFLQKSQPMTYTSSLAVCLERYAPEHVVSGGHLFFDYSPADIEMLLQHLSPQNLLIMISDRSFEDENNLREHWYGTSYNVNDIEPALLDQWANAVPPSDLHLPNRNPFIPTDFDLKPRVTPTLVLQNKPAIAETEKEPAVDVTTANGSKKRREYPCRLSNTGDVVFWYKQDTMFDMPKLYLGVQCRTPVAYESPASCAMTDVITRCLEETLNKYAYYADVASLSFQVSVTRLGFHITVAGFNHKAPVLLQTIVDTFKSMDISEALFARIKDKVIKGYQNFKFKQSFHHASYLSTICLEWPRWTHDEKCEALMPITVEQVRAFIPRLLSELKVEMMMNGNASPDECRELAAKVLSSLQCRTLPSSQEPENRVVMLEPGHTYIHRRTTPNPEEANSCVQNVYMVGATEPKSLGLARLLHRLVGERFFESLRTKQQLGYVVYAGRTAFGPQITAIQTLVQSHTHDPVYLDARIEEFWSEFRQVLADMPDDEFATNVNAVIEELVERPKNLGEESRQLWALIDTGLYAFDIRERTAEWMRQGVSRELMLEFFDAHVNPTSTTRRKFSAQVFGCKQTMPVNPPEQPHTHLVDDVATFRRQSALLAYPSPDPCFYEVYDFVANDSA